MTQVFVAAWVGVTVGWLGFGWALAEAPVELGHAAPHYAATQTLPGITDAVDVGALGELNLRG